MGLLFAPVLVCTGVATLVHWRACRSAQFSTPSRAWSGPVVWRYVLLLHCLIEAKYRHRVGHTKSRSLRFMEHHRVEVLTTQNIREKCVVVLHEVIWLLWWALGFDGQGQAALSDSKWLQIPFFGCALVPQRWLMCVFTWVYTQRDKRGSRRAAAWALQCTAPIESRAVQGARVTLGCTQGKHRGETAVWVSQLAAPT